MSRTAIRSKRIMGKARWPTSIGSLGLDLSLNTTGHRHHPEPVIQTSQDLGYHSPISLPIWNHCSAVQVIFHMPQPEEHYAQYDLVPEWYNQDYLGLNARQGGVVGRGHFGLLSKSGRLKSWSLTELWITRISPQSFLHHQASSLPLHAVKSLPKRFRLSLPAD